MTCRTRAPHSCCGDACGSRRSQQRGDALEVTDIRDLDQLRVALDDPDAPAARLDQGRAVIRRGDVALRVGLTHHGGYECLRRLHGTELVSIQSLDDATFGVD